MAHPALVAAVVAEVVPVPGRGVPVRGRGGEPLVGVAGVVGGQVAEQPPAALVDGGAQPGVGLVAAEQRVDPVERRGVVAVVALAGEDRGRVDDGGADLGDVVEVVDDPVQVAAEQLERGVRVRALEDDLVVPRGRHRPLGGGPLVGGRGAREAVREDLVDDAVAAPVGRGGVRGDPEVEGVRRVVVDRAGPGEPPLPVAGGEQEAVVRHRVVHRQRALPPHRVLVAGHDRARVERRLRVVRRADPHRVHRVAGPGPAPDLDRPAQGRHLVADVRRGAVVVRLVQQAHRDSRTGSRKTAPGPRGATSSSGLVSAQVRRLRQPQPMQPSRRSRSRSRRSICSSRRGRQRAAEP